MCLPATSVAGVRRRRSARRDGSADADVDTATQAVGRSRRRRSDAPAAERAGTGRQTTVNERTNSLRRSTSDDSRRRVNHRCRAGKTRTCRSPSKRPAARPTAAARSGIWLEAAVGWQSVLLALFVVPMFVGNYLANRWKMPDHGWKISLVLGTLAASILICTFGEFKFGPDLAGGITLVYELADTASQRSRRAGAAAQKCCRHANPLRRPRVQD